MSNEQVIKVDPSGFASEELDRAVAALESDDVVAFPTETVYGLGARALSQKAVARIFEVKGRPATNPLIVHVATMDQVHSVAREWPPTAQKLADAFWPGPLTLVLPRVDALPLEVCAGLDTVGVRMPQHPVALALIERVGPIAAPSANRYTGVSPTSAQHVVKSLGDKVPVVVDGGRTRVGLESTVVSLVGTPRVLRPGMISLEQLQAIVPEIEGPEDEVVEDVPAMSPGLARRHYAPDAQVVIAPPEARQMLSSKRVCVLRLSGGPAVTDALTIDLPTDPDAYAHALYDALHTCDESGCEFIVIEPPPKNAAWDAIWDRLHRAAEK